jgi:hypothetical protein
VTLSTTRLEMYSAELAAVDAATVMFSRVAVPTGSLAEAPTIDHSPSQFSTVQSFSVMSLMSGGKSPVWSS